MLRCPRCHRGRLFSGVISIVGECASCHLPLKEHEQGDGPAFFGILIIGALVAIFATIVEIKYAPSFWLHAALWIPLIVIGSLASIRYGKALLIHLQYRVKPWDFGDEAEDRYYVALSEKRLAEGGKNIPYKEAWK